MIIYDGEKYSCVSCIRGHRSSTCKHSNRMLVKVRTRGRPSAQTVRKVILVDASSQVNSGLHEEGDGGSPSCCSSAGARSCSKMNKQPILFLRTMSMQKALLVDGALKIMIEDNDPNFQGRYKFVSEKDYLLNHLDTSQKGCAMSAESITRAGSSEAQSLERFLSEGMSPASSSNKQELSEIKFEGHNETLVYPVQNIPREAGNASPEIANNSMVELFTHKGVYLSTQCNCADGNCLCVNCLIHRKEEELEKYIQQSGVPLSTIGNGRITFPEEQSPNNTFICRSPAEDCTAQECLLHPEEIIPLNQIFLYGLVNVPLRRKHVIKFRHKLIPSKFWWHLLKEELPSMPQDQWSKFDLLSWFEHIIKSFDSEIPNEPSGDGVNLHSMGLMMNA
ncbi:Copper-fist domain-containing protein [Lachancea thermotolerans]